MSTGTSITLYLAASIVTAIIGTNVARAKLRDAGFWMVACLLVPPLLLVLLVLPKRRFAKVRKPQSDDSDNTDDF